jgi:acetolactate synthase-1/2/3 large subunit
MTTSSDKPFKDDRRTFLKTATAVGISLGLPSTDARSEMSSGNEAQATAVDRPDGDGYTPEQRKRYFVDAPGSDFMVRVLASLGIEYIAVNPGASFRGLHESLINSSDSARPQIITCLHEEQAVAFAHGYAKVTGKPMAVACHGTVGFQHASMAVYNAWCDKVPILILGGNHRDAASRPFPVLWDHSAQDPVAAIRDATKWDDQPASLQHFAESTVRAYRVAITPPMGPVAIAIDSDLQERPVDGKPQIPRLSRVLPLQGDPGAVHEAAAQLASAEAPVIVVERYAGSQEGIDRLVELAELLQAVVIDRGARMNFPNTHYLNQTFIQAQHLAQADVILGLELTDVWGLIQQGRDRSEPSVTIRTARADVRVITIGTADLFVKSNYQNFQRYSCADVPISADAQATLPALIEAVRRLMTPQRSRINATRAARLRDSGNRMRAALSTEARYAWNARPVSTARLCMEIWEQIKSKDWALTSPTAFKASWPNKLWAMERHYQYIGDEGGYGIGYGCPASVGAALGHRAHGRLAVNIQGDGDLMYAPGALWTAVHHQIPLLTVMHNNAAYMQETMLIQAMALQRRRGVTQDKVKVGTEIDNPRIDFAALAKSMGMWSAGPIDDPRELREVLRRAVAVVAGGEPALVDVLCQPR